MHLKWSYKRGTNTLTLFSSTKVKSTLAANSVSAFTPHVPVWHLKYISLKSWLEFVE